MRDMIGMWCDYDFSPFALHSADVVRQAANGMSEARLRRLASLDNCRCGRRCFVKIRNQAVMSDLQRFLQVFWAMPKGFQDLYVQVSVLVKICEASKHVIDAIFLRMSQTKRLFSQVQQIAGGQQEKGAKRKWYLLSERMSPKCVVALLGLGNARMSRVQSGRKDGRFRLWGGVS